jgi:transposase
MMDALKENLSRSREIVFRATQKATDSKIDLVLFDVTTLHFETIEKDELRNFGYSKNFRFNTTQVTLALATTSNGLPVGYRLFPGNTAEVSTLMECIKLWRKELSIGKVIVIADRGMMSKENVEQLEHEKMQYIIAYPMKKSTAELKEEILSYTDYKANVIQNELFWTREIEIKPGQRLIVTYNEKRRDRDRKQRERLIEKIKKNLGPTKKAKNLVSNLGYLKYTKIGEQFVAELNESKIADDALWDGLHAVLTNTELAAKDAIDRYKKLWLIEDAFRLNKHNLKMRPIYHCTPERIKTHIEICFLTFALVRHAQERLKKAGYPMSIEDFREELISIEASIICDQSNGQLYRMPSHMTEQGRKIYKIFGREKHLQIQRLENI